MTSVIRLLRFAPEDSGVQEIVVSKKKLEKFLEAKDTEVLRPRKELEQARRKLGVHESPNVPPSVRNHAPGHLPARAPIPPGERQKAGPKPGHPGWFRRPMTPDRRIAIASSRCRN